MEANIQKFTSQNNFILRWLNHTDTWKYVYFRFQQLCYSRRPEIYNEIIIKNTHYGIVVDILIGFGFVIFLIIFSHPSYYLEQFVTRAEIVITKVEELVNKMIEMPVGLKLNRPLNISLGKFFLYHIYIWKTYIGLLKPLIDSLMQFAFLFSFLGLTGILCIFSDLISLSTIHICCFYGYAAKLSNFEISSLKSLWRLFRGKKYNNLKKRVDSYLYGDDQLCIGTIAFTILIFLLPTIIFYYVVFLVLRLVTMIIKIFLQLIIGFFLTFPIYSVFLWTVKSEKIKKDVYYYLDVNTSNSENILMVKLFPISIITLIKNENAMFSQYLASESPFSWNRLKPKNFLQSIFEAKLL